MVKAAFFKETRSGKLIAKFQIGYDVKGIRVFESCKAKTEKEARLLLKDLMEKHHAGINVS